MKATKLELEFIKKEVVGEKIYSFYFDTTGRNFKFNPGQYIKIFLDILKPDDRGTSRYFTISASPTDKNFITITTKVVKSSFKLALEKLKSGEKVRIFGPLGYFDFDAKDKRPKVFLSGGMGITPYHSILRYLFDKKINIPITLISSFPFKKEAIFLDEIDKFKIQNLNLKTITTLTKEDKVYPEFDKGRIDRNMINKYVQGLKTADFFVVGPEAFETSMRDILKKMEIPEENVFSENFPGY